MGKRPVRVVLTTKQIAEVVAEELWRPIVLHIDVGPYLKKLWPADPPKTEG
ncbi:hypothetical protein OOK41_09010 [Micromonospora sp. NBC_01655]|uniref:hypothetical protein n=1 Tax=Micromonospora sp. NBC_01655 TaxID=2975983 RepID=UPI0022561011|nr:hypothetical protein [Micromonospora sp. NBC_01655]MCX4470444.1 hypothetical protein [Micromonospora sp. NBC_01655]